MRRRYQTDRYGMISSFDIAEALRRGEQRRLERERRRLERAARVPSPARVLARLRGLVVLMVPRRSTA